MAIRDLALLGEFYIRLGKMRQRRHPNIVAVALANKNARIAWSLLTSDSAYGAGLSVRAA